MNKPSDFKERSSQRISELYNEYRREHPGESQQSFAEFLGISKNSLSQYLHGANAPGNITAAKIADKCGVDPLWVMGMADERSQDVARFKRTAETFNIHHASNEYGKTVAIPILRRVAAGIPLTSFDETIGYTYIPESMADKGTYFGLKISGDSMFPTVFDGDVVICREQPDAEDGQVVVAVVNGDDGVCKRMKKYDDGKIALMSDNALYAPMHFDNNEIDNIPVRVMGIVVELRRRL